MDIQQYLQLFFTFLNNRIIPFVLLLAFLFFMWNTFQYFILHGGDEDSQKKAKSFALWGILAFVIIIGFWGIINIFMTVFGIQGVTNPIVPDYMQMRPR